MLNVILTGISVIKAYTHNGKIRMNMNKNRKEACNFFKTKRGRRKLTNKIRNKRRKEKRARKIRHFKTDEKKTRVK